MFQILEFVKLKGNLYTIVTEHNQTVYTEKSLRCDRYNIGEDKYYREDRVIPSFIKVVYNVEASSNESYALLLTNVGLIHFTEENGFETDGDYIPYFARHSSLITSNAALFTIT